jgi:hypothetical protein
MSERNIRLELECRPMEIKTETSKEFFEVCALRDSMGFVCPMWSRGKVNGQWIIKLYWPDNTNP